MAPENEQKKTKLPDSGMAVPVSVEVTRQVNS